MGSSIDTEAIGNSVENSVQNLTQNGWGVALKTVLFAVVILFACLIVKHILLKILKKALDKGHIEKSFHTFIFSGLNILLWFITILLVAESFGIKANSLLALVGVVGLAVSLSVKDSLSNLAGGMTILSTQPFKVGDYVEIGSTGGVILEIGMVYTKLNTMDNRRILVPNSLVVDAQVTNYSTEELRRIDIKLSASYDASVEKVKDTIQAVIAVQDKILPQPAPFARLSAYRDSAMEYTVRVWCKNDDYWDIYHDLLEQIKTAFDQEKISIPYPQLEVSLRRED